MLAIYTESENPPQLPKLRVAGSSPVSRSKVNYLRVSGTVWFWTILPRSRGELREPGRAETLILDSQAVGPARASHSLRSDEVFGRHNPSVRQSGCQRQAQSDDNASLREPQNCACFGSADFWHITGRGGEDKGSAISGRTEIENRQGGLHHRYVWRAAA